MSELSGWIENQSIQADHLETVVDCFHRLFQSSYRTKLLCIGDEPLYRPAGRPGEFHEIFFANQSWNSALHEIAHWCIAGPDRRTRVDYGYWYCPDGRNDEEQALFEKVEVRPQALEWLFTSAFRTEFFASLDNLSAPPKESNSFRQALRTEALRLLQKGLSHRAGIFLQELLRVNHSETYFDSYWLRVAEKGLLPQ